MPRKKQEVQKVTVRIPNDLLDLLDQFIEENFIGSRNDFINNSLLDKVKKTSIKKTNSKDLLFNADF